MIHDPEVKLPFGRALGAALLVAGAWMISGIPALPVPGSFADWLLALTLLLYSVGLALLGLTLLVGSRMTLRALPRHLLLSAAVLLALAGANLGWLASREPEARTEVLRALIALAGSIVAIRAWRQQRSETHRGASTSSGPAS